MEVEISKYPKIVSKLDKKMKTCRQLIQNYEAPMEGQSIYEIVDGLMDEEIRLQDEITKQNDYIDELDAKIREINESICILDMKYHHEKHDISSEEDEEKRILRK
jgi:hypothetical protein